MIYKFTSVKEELSHLILYFYLDLLQEGWIICKPEIDHPKPYFTSWWGK